MAAAETVAWVKPPEPIRVLDLSILNIRLLEHGDPRLTADGWRNWLGI